MKHFEPPRFLLVGFQYHAFQNRSKSKSKPFNRLSLESEKRKREICKHSHQDSGHSNFFYRRYAEKRFLNL